MTLMSFPLQEFTRRSFCYH